MNEVPGRAHEVDSPLFEYDPAPRAFIEPSEQVSARDVPQACVLTFFGDVVQDLRERAGTRVLTENRWEDGPHPLLEVERDGRRLAVLHSGGAGSLTAELTLGHLVVVTSAVRDEGTSHHYLPAARYIDADRRATSVLEQTLADHDVPFVTGRSWTTDAPYRETPGKIAARRREGCLTVEMEASALAAVAQFRGARLAQVVYCGDDLSGHTWGTGSGRPVGRCARTSSTSPASRRCVWLVWLPVAADEHGQRWPARISRTASTA